MTTTANFANSQLARDRVLPEVEVEVQSRTLSLYQSCDKYKLIIEYFANKGYEYGSEACIRRDQGWFAFHKAVTNSNIIK